MKSLKRKDGGAYRQYKRNVSLYCKQPKKDKTTCSAIELYDRAKSIYDAKLATGLYDNYDNKALSTLAFDCLKQAKLEILTMNRC